MEKGQHVRLPLNLVTDYVREQRIRVITYDAKVIAEMSNTFKPCCRLLIQPDLFLLERAMSELQLLYQTYFLRKNLKERKSQEPSTSKKCLATCKNLYFSKISDYMDQVLTKNIPKCRASKPLSIPALFKFFRSFLTL